jgi:hypothetical protein
MAIAPALVVRIESVEWGAADGDGNARWGNDDSACGVVAVTVTVTVAMTVTGGECGDRGEQECCSD